jgi:hypothetical protein
MIMIIMLVMSKYWNRERNEYYAEDDLSFPYSSGIGSCHDYYMLGFDAFNVS